MTGSRLVGIFALMGTAFLLSASGGCTGGSAGQARAIVSTDPSKVDAAHKAAQRDVLTLLERALQDEALTQSEFLLAQDAILHRTGDDERLRLAETIYDAATELRHGYLLNSLTLEDWTAAKSQLLRETLGVEVTVAQGLGAGMFR